MLNKSGMSFQLAKLFLNNYFSIMKIPVSKKRPSIEELTALITNKFSNRYACKMVTIGKAKSIFVKKSTFVAVQIQIPEEESEIIVEGTFQPSLFTLIPWFIDILATNGLVFGLPFRPERRELEEEVGRFLKQAYN